MSCTFQRAANMGIPPARTISSPLKKEAMSNDCTQKHSGFDLKELLTISTTLYWVFSTGNERYLSKVRNGGKMSEPIRSPTRRLSCAAICKEAR